MRKQFNGYSKARNNLRILAKKKANRPRIQKHGWAGFCLHIGSGTKNKSMFLCQCPFKKELKTVEDKKRRARKSSLKDMKKQKVREWLRYT